MVVFAVSDWPSFKMAEKCVAQIRELDRAAPVWLVGTMIDALARRVTHEGAS